MKPDNQYWQVKDDNGFLHLLDPDKEMHAYIKWDGTVHLWYYDDSPYAFDHDTGLEDHRDFGFKSKANHDLYRLFEIDEEIGRLQSLKSLAVKWFDEKKNQRWPPDLFNLSANSVRENEPAWNDESRDREAGE